MIRFNILEKRLEIFRDEKQIQIINLVNSTVTNKYFIVTTFIENLSKTFEDFDDWFCNLLDEYNTVIERYPVIQKNIPQLKDYVDRYLKVKNLDFNQFVDESKAKKASILFTAEEIESIIKLSCYLKIYSLFSNSNLKLDARLHKKVYNELAYDVLNSEVVNKIFNIIKTKTFRYNLTDKFMWDYIKMIQCKSIDVHIIEIFNFIMNQILILCEEDKNPITYFVTVVQESINWFLRSVYKSQIVYDDTVSTEDIHSSNIDNLKTYSYNDTLGRLKGVAFEQIYDNLERSSILLFNNTDSIINTDKAIVEFQSRLSQIEFISPLCDSLVYPVLSRVTSIPYVHFKTLTPDYSVVLSVYTQNLLRKVFKITEYRNLFSLLSYYPKKTIAVATTYKVKSMEDFIKASQSVNNFFGFKSKLLFGNMLGYFIGRISRVNFMNIFDGNELAGVPLSKIESEMIQFYTMLFAGKFEDEFVEMKKLMYKDF